VLTDETIELSFWLLSAGVLVPQTLASPRDSLLSAFECRPGARAIKFLITTPDIVAEKIGLHDAPCSS
jgi:hypothetical protein